MISQSGAAASAGLIGAAMAVLALLIGGGFMFQFGRRNDREEFDDDDDIDVDTDSLPIDGADDDGAPAFGVPCFNWGGLDRGHRMKGEVI